MWESRTDVLAKVLVVTSTQVDIGNKAASVHPHIVEELSLETQRLLPCKLVAQEAATTGSPRVGIR